MVPLNGDLQLRVLRSACDRDLRLLLGIPPDRLTVPVAFRTLLESQLRQAFVGWLGTYELTLASGRFSVIHHAASEYCLDGCHFRSHCYYQVNSRPSDLSFTWINSVIMNDEEHAHKFEMEQCKAKKQSNKTKHWWHHDVKREQPMYRWIGETKRQFTMRKQWTRSHATHDCNPTKGSLMEKRT